MYEIDVALLRTQMRLQIDIAKMAGIQNVEDAKTVEVGQTYFVNVVTTHKDGPAHGAHFPVLGDEHDDKDFIPVFPDSVPHWHIDWRFIPKDQYADTVKLFLTLFGQNAEINGQTVVNGGWASDTKNLQLACVLPAGAIARAERWPLPCWRKPLRWESIPDWLAPLEAAHKDKRVCDNVCPHRGISLVGAPQDASGVRVCPGHGLAWDRKGCMVSRTGGAK